MTDRELLEMAAKAAGLDFRGREAWYEDYAIYDNETDTNIQWNPLSRDGDALRLAVKLNLGVLSEDSSSVAWDLNVREEVEANGDPYAATRRAIVLAAAEIGKEMP